MTRRPPYNRGRMRTITVTRTVDAPREQVFDYLSDIANHAEFSDHYLNDFRLERLQSSGMGAAASYRLDFPLGRQWGDAVITDLESPHLDRAGGQHRPHRAHPDAGGVPPHAGSTTG